MEKKISIDLTKNELELIKELLTIHEKQLMNDFNMGKLDPLTDDVFNRHGIVLEAKIEVSNALCTEF